MMRAGTRLATPVLVPPRCRSCMVHTGQPEPRPRPAEKTYSGFSLALRMAGGGRILLCFSGIIATKSDMEYRFLCNYAVGLLSPTEQRIIARSKTGGSAKL